MDINNDGLADLVAGDSSGNIWFFRNIGTKTQPKLAQAVLLQSDGKPITGVAPDYSMVGNQLKVTEHPDRTMGIYSKIHVADWDNDGLLDILVGQESPGNGESEIIWYRNIGAPNQMKLDKPQQIKLPGQRFSRPSPYVVDWDGDGKRDLLLGTEDNQVYFLRNMGTNAQPVWANPVPLDIPDLKGECRCRISVVDWNEDGKLDLLVGTFYSGSGGDGKSMGGHVWLFLRR